MTPLIFNAWHLYIYIYKYKWSGGEEERTSGNGVGEVAPLTLIRLSSFRYSGRSFRFYYFLDSRPPPCSAWGEIRCAYIHVIYYTYNVYTYIYT